MILAGRNIEELKKVQSELMGTKQDANSVLVCKSDLTLCMLGKYYSGQYCELFLAHLEHGCQGAGLIFPIYLYRKI